MPAPSANAAPFRRHQLAERRQHQIERAAGEAEADQHAGAEVERQRRRGIAHQRQAGGIQQRADARSRAACRSGRRSRRRTAGPCPTADSGSRARAEHVAAPARIRWLIGCTKKPKVERGPKVSSAIRQPQTTITSGVRQVGGASDEPSRLHCRHANSSESAIAGCRQIGDTPSRTLMHSHGNPNRRSRRNVPPQCSVAIAAVSLTNLTGRASGEARAGMLYLICSL